MQSPSIPGAKSLLDHDKFRRGVVAHPVSRPRKAGPDGVLVAAWSFGDRSYLLVRTANDVAGRERCFRSHIDNKALMLRITLPDHGCPCFDAESRVPFRTLD